MITNKDIRVENGNLVLNGDKYPVDGQSPEAIMQIVEDNSDSTPTAESTAPITSGGVFAADKDITDTIGDITQTGIIGATVAAQLGNIHGQIGSLKFAVFEHEFTDVDITNAWGSMYESTDTLSFDISSLGLQSSPKFAIVGIRSTGAAVMLTAATNTATAINFRAVRPSTASGLTIVATAFVIY